MGKKTDGDVSLRRELFFQNAIRQCQRMQTQYKKVGVAGHFSSVKETASVGSDTSGPIKFSFLSSRSCNPPKKTWDSSTRHVDKGPYVPMHTNCIRTRVNEQKNKPELRDERQRGWKT